MKIHKIQRVTIINCNDDSWLLEVSGKFTRNKKALKNYSGYYPSLEAVWLFLNEGYKDA